MNPLKDFKEYIQEGIIKKQQPNISRAKFLIKESETQLSFIKELVSEKGINEKNANSIIKLSYDVIMESIRANMLTKGYNALGSFAHEAEVSYLRELKFSEYDIQFLNDLRYSRNGIMYYGKILDQEYAKKVFSFLGSIYAKLKNTK